jgi:hypothetical protein
MRCLLTSLLMLLVLAAPASAITRAERDALESIHVTITPPETHEVPFDEAHKAELARARHAILAGNGVAAEQALGNLARRVAFNDSWRVFAGTAPEGAPVLLRVIVNQHMASGYVVDLGTQGRNLAFLASKNLGWGYNDLRWVGATYAGTQELTRLGGDGYSNPVPLLRFKAELSVD